MALIGREVVLKKAGVVQSLEGGGSQLKSLGRQVSTGRWQGLVGLLIFFCGQRPLPFGGSLCRRVWRVIPHWAWYHTEPYARTSGHSIHHRQSVCAVKNGALPTEPRGRLGPRRASRGSHYCRFILPVVVRSPAGPRVRLKVVSLVYSERPAERQWAPTTRKHYYLTKLKTSTL